MASVPNGYFTKVIIATVGTYSRRLPAKSAMGRHAGLVTLALTGPLLGPAIDGFGPVSGDMVPPVGCDSGEKVGRRWGYQEAQAGRSRSFALQGPPRNL